MTMMSTYDYFLYELVLFLFTLNNNNKYWMWTRSFKICVFTSTPRRPNFVMLDLELLDRRPVAHNNAHIDLVAFLIKKKEFRLTILMKTIIS